MHRSSSRHAVLGEGVLCLLDGHVALRKPDEWRCQEPDSIGMNMYREDWAETHASHSLALDHLQCQDRRGHVRNRGGKTISSSSQIARLVTT